MDFRHTLRDETVGAGELLYESQTFMVALLHALVEEWDGWRCGVLQCQPPPFPTALPPRRERGLAEKAWY
jgi:hypothetical protein